MKFNEDRGVALTDEKKKSLQEIKIKIMTYLDKKFRDDEDSK
jgi:hypothetical protein